MLRHCLQKLTTKSEQTRSEVADPTESRIVNSIAYNVNDIPPTVMGSIFNQSGSAKESQNTFTLRNSCSYGWENPLEWGQIDKHRDSG